MTNSQSTSGHHRRQKRFLSKPASVPYYSPRTPRTALFSRHNSDLSLFFFEDHCDRLLSGFPVACLTLALFHTLSPNPSILLSFRNSVGGNIGPFREWTHGKRSLESRASPTFLHGAQ